MYKVLTSKAERKKPMLQPRCNQEILHLTLSICKKFLKYIGRVRKFDINCPKMRNRYKE